MRRIESYASPYEVKERIFQLREQGVTESAITLVAKEDLYENEFMDYHIKFKQATGSVWDKFISFFTAEEPEDRIVRDLGLTEEETTQYERDLEDGGILLYVNDYEVQDDGTQPKPTSGARNIMGQDKNYKVEDENNGQQH